MRKAKIAEYGDFQTPPGLAKNVCVLLAKHGLRPSALVEPTCGLGSFVFAGLDCFNEIKKAVGADINGTYIKQAEALLHQRTDANKVKLIETDFFTTDWKKTIAFLPEPILVIGNLPWVTNAYLGRLGSQNLPTKSNFQNRNGLDAITGKANFDISEWMLIRLTEAMNGRRGALAMLCKSSVARKTLFHAWKSEITLERSAIYRIDASLHFDAAVDAVLLVMHFAPGTEKRGQAPFPASKPVIAERTKEAPEKVPVPFSPLYAHLNGNEIETVIGYEDGMLLADITAYHRWKHLSGNEVVKWRSGIKHDCSKVMELYREGEKYRNGFGELVDLEDAYVFPMLKSSHVAKGGTKRGSRYMLVTQRTVGEDTARIQQNAPNTWAYLNAHAHVLNKRGSSIYRKRPPFSIFGVGDYSFALWKVAISGFYKKLLFITVGPSRGKPVVLDDTSYFLSCETKEQAEYAAALLNSPAAQSFYEAFVFWDAKRPITADLLGRLDLGRLAKEIGSEEKFHRYFGKAKVSEKNDAANEWKEGFGVRNWS